MELINLQGNAAAWNTLWAMEAQSLRNLVGSSHRAAESQPDKPAAKPYTVSGSTAIIPIVGIIGKYPSILDALFGGVSTIALQSQIDAAINDDEVDNIVLYIDSPGGTVSGTTDLAEYIAAAKETKPITAYVSDHCFSAAYWIASQCTRIIANEGAFIGSIGVYSIIVDNSKAAADAGITVHLVSSGDYKGLEEEGLPIDGKAIEETQRQVNSAAMLFQNSVATGRKLPNNTVKQLADGRIHIASDAMKLKLIDAIGSIDMAMGATGDQPNMDDNKTVAAEPAPSDDVLSKILDAITALSAKLDKMNDEDEQEDEGDDEACDKADDEGADDESAKAAAAHVDRLKAISEACGGRAEFAIAQFIAGKSPVEAKAALVDVLHKENVELRKNAKSADGIEPLALGGPVESTDSNDPEVIWKQNINGVQERFSGKQNYFMAAFKHEKANKGAK